MPGNHSSLLLNSTASFKPASAQARVSARVSPQVSPCASAPVAACVLASVLALALALAPLPAQGDPSAEPGMAGAEPERAAEQRAVADRERLEREAMVADAQRSVEDAVRAMEEARQRLAGARADEDEDLALLREDLGRAHRTLRDASRDVARAHRELAIADRGHRTRVRVVNLGDRALLGVLLGPAETNGVRLVGLSPDGPAERAGLLQGDVLAGIGGVSLSGRSDEEAREAVFGVMEHVRHGDEVPVTIIRGEERLDLTVVAEQREPASWQSLVQLPPDAPLAPHVVVERIDVPDIDYELLDRKLERIEEQLRHLEYRFVGEDGEMVEFSHDFRFAPGDLSRVGRLAVDEADMVFGLPHTRGLEMVELNPELGRYFKAERGVLVVRVDADNAYGLESGDVILQVAGGDVESPADVLRALRGAEPGTELELAIKRDRRERTLRATVPEKRLGALSRPLPPAPPVHRTLPAEPPTPPTRKAPPVER